MPWLPIHSPLCCPTPRLRRSSARQVLDAAYFLSYPQWQQVLDHLQLPLQVTADQAAFPHDGLATLVQYLEAHYRSLPTTEAPIFPPATPELLPAPKTRKQTYSLAPEVIEWLARVCHWRRLVKSDVVNEALAQWLRQYPESGIPLPGPDDH